MINFLKKLSLQFQQVNFFNLHYYKDQICFQSKCIRTATLVKMKIVLRQDSWEEKRCKCNPSNLGINLNEALENMMQKGPKVGGS